MGRGGLKNGFCSVWQMHMWFGCSSIPGGKSIPNSGDAREGAITSGEMFICKKKILPSSYLTSLGSPLLNFLSAGCSHPSPARTVVHVLDWVCPGPAQPETGSACHSHGHRGCSRREEGALSSRADPPYSQLSRYTISLRIRLCDFPGSPVLKTPPFNAGVGGSIPGQGAKISHATWPQNQNVKQKQYCNKVNTDRKKSFSTFETNITSLINYTSKKKSCSVSFTRYYL